ncbi:MAG: sigma-70 family RNA polymerase sigma factor [Solirubrobacteraceae bacterium]
MNDTDRRRRLEALFHGHAATVRAYAARRADGAAADDITSDVFVIAWRRLDDVPEDALPWLLACARRVVANRWRATRRQTALRERLRLERPPASGPAIRDSALSEALRSLRPEDREVLMLIAWEGLDAGQAATVIGCTRRALTMRLHRARRRLAAALASADPAWTDPMEAM